MQPVSSLSPLLALYHHRLHSVSQFLHPRRLGPHGGQRGKHCVHRHSRSQRLYLPVLQWHRHQLLPARDAVRPPIHHHCICFIRPVQQLEKSSLQNQHGYISLQNIYQKTVCDAKSNSFRNQCQLSMTSTLFGVCFWFCNFKDLLRPHWFI